VGSGCLPYGFEAFWWRDGDGMHALGDLSGGAFNSCALAASADGSIVVGYGTTDAGRRAFIWDYRTCVMHDLKSALVEQYGLSDEEGGELYGWTLTEATAITPDGRVVVGYGDNEGGTTEAWRAILGRMDFDPDETDEGAPGYLDWDYEWSDVMAFVVLDEQDKVQFEVIKYVWVEAGFLDGHCETGVSGTKLEHLHFTVSGTGTTTTVQKTPRSASPRRRTTRPPTGSRAWRTP